MKQTVSKIMIGDCLLVDGSIIQVTRYNIQYILETLCQPVDLTPELLQKLGFEKVQNLYILKWNNKVYSSLIFIEYNPENSCLYVNDMMIPKPVRYFHELQHVFDLCGIDRRISCKDGVISITEES